jgi:hypothetical protein
MTRHYFSTLMDEDCIRCEECGMNVLSPYKTCEEYTAYNQERNRKLRERWVTNS